MTEPYDYAKIAIDYITADRSAPRALILEYLAENTNEEIADEAIDCWDLDDDGRVVDRDALIDEIAWIRGNVDIAIPEEQE